MQPTPSVAAPAAPAASAASAAPAAPAIDFNGRALDAAGRAQLHLVEAVLGAVPAGRYWYDTVSGAAGVMGGPAAAYLGPGLVLGGNMPAHASGGGDGRLTGVYVNGRELHPLDVAGLRRFGQVYAGRYWWDRYGNVGIEAGPMLFNFYALVQAASVGNSTYRRGARPGDSSYVGKGCAAVHGRLRSSDEASSYSYYVGC